MIFKKILDFYIKSSLHVALAVVAFSMVTYLSFHIPINNYVLLFIFFSTITGYNFIKYSGLTLFHYRSLSKKMRGISILSLFSMVGLIITLFYQSKEVIIVSAMLGIFTLLYALPISEKHKNLRGVPGLKIYIIAFVVAGVTVVLPLLETDNFPAQDHIIDFLQRSIIAVVLILPFEIRDMDKDTIQLSTIPQKIGVRRTKLLGYILICFFFLIEFLKRDVYLEYLISLGFLGIIAMIFLRKSSIKQGEYYSSFWVEAAPWFWLGFFYLLKYFI